MSLLVKDKILSRFRQQRGYAYEFNNHCDEFRKFSRPQVKNSKRKTLRDKRPTAQTTALLDMQETDYWELD